MTSVSGKSSKPSNFRQFFLRGLGVLLPTILTIWILVAIYQFVSVKIASPINHGLREVIVRFSPWPEPAGEFILTSEEAAKQLTAGEMSDWNQHGRSQEWLDTRARRLTLEKGWNQLSIGQWQILDIIGLLIAATLIYITGFLLGGLIGRGLLKRAEDLIRQVPIVSAIYPSVKQVTDFFFGDDTDPALRFNKVVAVEYPRKGIWTVGLLTGDTMQTIQGQAGRKCLTVFIPNSPAPFTGYTIMVPEDEVTELDISIDDALKFTISAGVVIPESETLAALGSKAPAGLENEPTGE
jgi:uncharacterized membrane protein